MNFTSCHPLASPTRRNPLTSTSPLSEILRAHPIKPYQAWTPSSEMQVSPKSTLLTGLPLFNNWATAWSCTKRGKLQKTTTSTTSNQGGSLRPAKQRQQLHPSESFMHTIQSPNTSPVITYHDHLPFVGKRMHQDAQRSSSHANLST